MKNIANYISISRIIMSIMLLIPETFSITFYIIYIYCGISDMLDGFIARKSKNESKIGARLDSASDIIFVIVVMIKILPILNLTNEIIIWIVFIVFIKIINVICSYIFYKKIVLPHTIANKITGFILFIAPFIILNTNSIVFEIIICSIATFAAVQEGHYIRTRIIIYKGEFIMAMWNPWRGCKKCSDGCLHCYIHKGDLKRNINTNINTNNIVKTKDFEKPIEKLKNGNYKMKSGIVYLCFSTDFLIEEADEWRKDCWKMIKERHDCTFLFLTKRIDRFMKCIPDDWENGYDNVVVCCTIENQKNADYKLSIFKDLPIKHKCITAQPLLEKVDIEKYLDDIELVVVGGESDMNARSFDYEWALDIREQCIRKNVDFEFRQCGTYTIIDGKKYKIQTKDLCKQAKLANINYKSNR